MIETTRFEFKKSESNVLPAIYFQVGDKEVLVCPDNLYQTLWESSGKRVFCKGITAHFLFLRDIVCGNFMDYSKGYYSIDFNKDDFVNSAIDSLKLLCEAIIRGEQVAYESIRVKDAERILEGLESLIIPKNYSLLFMDDINLEDFSFEFIEPYSCDTRYKITIGKREYQSYISDWGTNFDIIRMEMEKYVFSDTEIKIYNEDIPTILRLDDRYIHQDNIYLTKVTVEPDSFTKGPIMFGWCAPKQVIRNLYLGLLSLCITESDWFDSGNEGGTWTDFRIATYNKLQSCLIEQYIKGYKKDDFSYSERQRVVRTVEEMQEDYKNLLATLNCD